MVSKSYRSKAVQVAEASEAAVVEATARQHAAADPSVSVLLQASAGTGKTRVLVDRMVRLCLAGASARSLLAITFTRKAAAEILDRTPEAMRALIHRGSVRGRKVGKPGVWVTTMQEVIEYSAWARTHKHHERKRYLTGRYVESV